MTKAPTNGFEDWYTIRTHEIDYCKKLTIPALLMLMQEASMENALMLHISVWDKGMEDLSWVILRKEVTINRLPTLNEKIKVITYPAGFQRIFAYRDFWVIDEIGEVIATASSTWTLMNLKTRKIQRIPQHILDLDVPLSEEKLVVPALKLSVPEHYNKGYTYQIRHYDLDWNHHVNNIIFSKLMMQAVPQDILGKKKIKSFTIHIKSECYLDEKVNVGIQYEKEDVIHHNLLGNDNRIIAIAKSQWSD